MFPVDLVTQGAMLILAAAGNQVCQMPKPADIAVLPKANELKIDTSQTTAQIQAQEIDTINPYSYGHQTHTNGYMKGLISMRPKVTLDFKLVPNSDYACIWYDAVEIQILIDPTIVIPKEVAADDCMYNAVKTHEMKHVKVDRWVVNKYAKTMGAKVFDGLKQRGFIAGPIPAKNAEETADRMRDTVRQLLELEYKKMVIERAERQQAVDSLEEYQYVQSQCPDYKSPVK